MLVMWRTTCLRSFSRLRSGCPEKVCPRRRRLSSDSAGDASRTTDGRLTAGTDLFLLMFPAGSSLFRRTRTAGTCFCLLVDPSGPQSGVPPPTVLQLRSTLLWPVIEGWTTRTYWTKLMWNLDSFSCGTVGGWSTTKGDVIPRSFSALSLCENIQLVHNTAALTFSSSGPLDGFFRSSRRVLQVLRTGSSPQSLSDKRRNVSAVCPEDLTQPA